MTTTYIGTTDVAKMARLQLKAKWPHIQFSAKSKKYSGGSSIDVSWTNGPTESQVEQLIGHLHGSSFDPMQDMKENNGRPYMNDYIFFNRHVTEDIYLAMAQKIVKEFAHTEHLNPETDMDKTDQKLMDYWHRWTLRQLAWKELKDLTLV